MKKIAFVFPGQGSQTVGMLAQLVDEHPSLSSLFEEASDALGYDMQELMLKGPADRLNATEYTQPALLTAGVLCWQVWKNLSTTSPDYLAGHSLGEYTALVCAESLRFSDALRLVAARGRYMQEAVPEGVGAMAAIVGLEDAGVEQACHRVASVGLVTPANYNSIGQVVIAGESAAVDAAVQEAKTLGAKIAKRIPVSVPSHCALMKPAAEKLAALLATIEIKSPRIPVINNVDVSMAFEPEKIKAALVRQLFSPVQWVKTIHTLVANGVTEVIECGPGKVLTGLNKRIDPSLRVDVIHTTEQMKQVLEGSHE